MTRSAEAQQLSQGVLAITQGELAQTADKGRFLLYPAIRFASVSAEMALDSARSATGTLARTSRTRQHGKGVTLASVEGLPVEANTLD
jgi:hypothetical protein